MNTIVDGNTVETIKTSQRVGDTAVHKEKVVATQQVDANELQLAKTNQVVWLIIHLIGAIITLRFFFLLFSANLTGFALLVYNLSVLFVRPFEGIFPAPSASGSYFDSAALLALAIWYLFGYLMTRILALFSNRVTAVESDL